MRSKDAERQNCDGYQAEEGDLEDQAARLVPPAKRIHGRVSMRNTHFSRRIGRRAAVDQSTGGVGSSASTFGLKDQARAWIEQNGLVVILLGAAACVLLLGVAPYLFGGDLWLNLVSGREIVDHGLPRVDRLTVFAQGQEWIDQQWLANLVFYGLERVGGLTLISLVGAAFVVVSFTIACAAARWRGASQRATVAVASLALISASWGYSLRAQLLALPLYVVSLWLLVDARQGIRRRTFLVVPITLLWANLHGSVLVIVVLTCWLSVVLVARSPRDALPQAALLPLLTAGAALATPYGPVETLQYFELLLVDPPFSDLIVEWRRPELNLLTAPFFVLASLTVVLCARQWRRLTTFELGALALTLAGAVSALRGVIWFTLLTAVLLPTAVDSALRLRDAPVRAKANRWIAAITGAAVLACGAALVARGDDWLESEWPTGMLQPLREETRRADARVWGTDLTADWLLWHQPDLAGRIAYDVRFELLSPRQLKAIARYNGELGDDWITIADGFDVVVIDAKDDPSHVGDFLAEPGSRLVYRDDRASLIIRPESRRN
jgi:hypothetical protein